MDFGALIKATRKNKVTAKELSKFPEVKRDLALLIDKEVTFSALRDIAFAAERKLLKRVSLFDVYEGDKLPEGVFEEREQSPLGGFVESAIEQMGVNPVLARDGYDSWLFHKGSSEIRIFVYDNSYLFSTSPINLLPKKEVEPVLDYMLSEDFGPYKLGIEGRQIYIAYRIHLSDITDESEEEIRKNIVDLAFRADAMDNMLVERFGCEFSEYSKADAQ